ncbi:MAG: molecular chaperone GrpE [Baekduia sp.]|jgi:molecular chaperone GrpE|nr:molecular chaperone GrpE [Baekduia sp.]
MPSSRASDHQREQQQAAQQPQQPQQPPPGGPGDGAPDDAAAAAQAEAARLEDRLKRALADLDNFRKRSSRELDRRTAEAADAIVRDWLEVADSIDRALAARPEGEADEGLRAVADQISATLAREGVTRSGERGEPFDPERHDAVDVRLSPDAEDRTIFDVARAGYERGGRVLRPAQVVVGRRASPPPADGTQPAGPGSG